jgi:hypothetical protein
VILNPQDSIVDGAAVRIVRPKAGGAAGASGASGTTGSAPAQSEQTAKAQE